MKVVVIKNNLKNAVDLVFRICGDSNHLPVLKNILIKAEGSNLYLSTTNLELAITVNCNAKIIESGAVTVPASLINSIINNLASEVINLELLGSVLYLKTDSYKAEINTIPVDDFPIIPHISINKSTKFIKIQSNILKESFNQVLSATHISDLRPEINGILLNFNGGVIQLAGTDSFRLAEKTINNNNFTTNLELGFKTVIPIKSVNEVINILNKEDEVILYFDNNQVLFKTEQIEFLSRIMDINFPDYKQIIPKEVMVEVILEKEELINALKVTKVFSTSVSDVLLSIKSNLIELSSSSQGVGENKYIVTAKVKGNSFEVRFNSLYLLSGIKSFKGDTLVLGVNGDDKPTKIKAGKDSSYFYILMPVKG